MSENDLAPLETALSNDVNVECAADRLAGFCRRSDGKLIASVLAVSGSVVDAGAGYSLPDALAGCAVLNGHVFIRPECYLALGCRRCNRHHRFNWTTVLFQKGGPIVHSSCFGAANRLGARRCRNIRRGCRHRSGGNGIGLNSGTAGQVSPPDRCNEE